MGEWDGKLGEGDRDGVVVMGTRGGEAWIQGVGRLGYVGWGGLGMWGEEASLTYVKVPHQ